ncbi:MAG: hypothetical protein WCC10_09540 [Tumebacillaceae bacterium]
MKQQGSGLGVQVILGIFGFFLAGALSLAAGNTVMTSLVRGVIGLFGLFFLGFLLQFAFRAFIGVPSQSDELRGKHIDLLLLEQPPTPRPASDRAGDEGQDEFVPLAQTLRSGGDPTNVFREMDPVKIAEALRHLDD